MSAVRAFALDALDRPPRLRGDVPDPEPAAGEVLVRVRASSVNPADAAIVSGMVAQMLEHEFPVTLGRDFAGVVERTGSDVKRFAHDDWVYGFVPMAAPTVRRGSWAERIAVPESGAAPKPEGVDIAAAGAAPLAGVAAVMALDALALQPGEALVVIGATGGVGSLAVQLARSAGAHVIAPALRDDEGFLRSLGVIETVPREGDVAAAVRERHPDGVEGVLDLVSNAPEHAELLREGGRLVSTLGAAGEGPERANVTATPDPEPLARLGALLDDGTLRVPIQRVYRFEDAGEALAALGGEHTQGKLALAL